MQNFEFILELYEIFLSEIVGLIITFLFIINSQIYCSPSISLIVLGINYQFIDYNLKFDVNKVEQFKCFFFISVQIILVY